jgi:serine palmitoyltransferase
MHDRIKLTHLLSTSPHALPPPYPELYQEIDELVLDWTPEPLVAPPSLTSPDNALLSSLPVIAGPTGPKVKLVSNPNKTVINFASYNFTGLAEHEKLKEAALDTLRKYGVGTCGPSGFYGTIGR